MAPTPIRFICYGIPIGLSILGFVAYISYLMHGMEIFVPLSPKHPGLLCDTFQGTDKSGLRQYLENRVHTILGPPDKHCWEIRKRRYLPMDIPRYLVVPHNLLVIRHVSRDYNFTETALTMLYSPQNFYCFTIDKNATDIFKEKIRFLSLCLPNVIVPEDEINGDDAEEYFRGSYKCITELHKYPWEHIVIVQEEEVPIRSVQSLTLLLSKLNNSSLIGRDKFTFHNNTSINMTSLDMSLLKWIKRRTEPIYLSRPFQPFLYDYLLNNDTIKRLEENAITRVDKKCTNELRDKWGNCVKGMEDYDYTIRSHDFFVRVDPSFDFGFVQCMHERVFRKTYEEHLPL